MMTKNGFMNFIKKRKLKEISVNKYANAIDTLSSELDNYGLEKTDLYNISDTTIINRILSNPNFQQKNQKGNNMYSAALNHFKNYMKDYNDQDQFQTELLKEEIEFEKYLKKTNNDVKGRSIVDKVLEKPNYYKVNNQKIWSRNSGYASDAIASADYLCEFNNQHQHFVSKFTQKNYVEAHHLIPMKFQDQFDCSLDTHANIVSLCLVCHKKIHFGLFKDKKEILDKLFHSRKERLIKSGINIEIEELYSYYLD